MTVEIDRRWSDPLRGIQNRLERNDLVDLIPWCGPASSSDRWIRTASLACEASDGSRSSNMIALRNGDWSRAAAGDRH